MGEIWMESLIFRNVDVVQTKLMVLNMAHTFHCSKVIVQSVTLTNSKFAHFRYGTSGEYDIKDFQLQDVTLKEQAVFWMMENNLSIPKLLFRNIVVLQSLFHGQSLFYEAASTIILEFENLVVLDTDFV